MYDVLHDNSSALATRTSETGVVVSELTPSACESLGGFARFRWIILTLIFSLSFCAFIERLTLSVAAERMMPELGITQAQVGWLLTAFVVGYTVCQFPGGLVGLRFGARRVLFVSALLSAAANFSLILAPAVALGTSLVVLMWTSRLVLGIVQAPLYPVSSGALAAWFPPEEWAWALGLLVTGIGLGAAVTPPAVAWMMGAFGWRQSVCAASVPGVAAAILWWTFGRDGPNGKQDPASTVPASGDGTILRQSLALLVDRNVIALTISYVLDNAAVYLITYWSFLYLVQERHLTVLESGTLASVPFLVGAIGAGIGGRLCDRLCVRFGARWGVRIVPLSVLPLVGAFLYLAATISSPYMAVLALTGCYTGLQMTEGSYWSAAMRIGESRTMAVTGVLNTGGNLGGVLITPVIGYLSGNHAWIACFAIGTVCVVGAALLWLVTNAIPPRDHTNTQRPP
jgi:ACS family glucarate transporter-like MFS transporter